MKKFLAIVMIIAALCLALNSCSNTSEQISDETANSESSRSTETHRFDIEEPATEKFASSESDVKGSDTTEIVTDEAISDVKNVTTSVTTERENTETVAEESITEAITEKESADVSDPERETLEHPSIEKPSLVETEIEDSENITEEIKEEITEEVNTEKEVVESVSTTGRPSEEVTEPEKEVVSITYLEFISMSPAEQQTYMNSFGTDMAGIQRFMAWYAEAKAAYDAEQATAEQTDVDINIGDYVGNN